MQIRQHKLPRGSIKEVSMAFDPLTIWVVSDVELTVEPGDSLGDVAEAIRPHLPELGMKQLRSLVAYWFTLGERVASGDTGPWSKKDKNRNPRRRYKPKASPGG